MPNDAPAPLLSRRFLLLGTAATAASALLAACGQEPQGTAGATNSSPTPAPTRIIPTVAISPGVSGSTILERVLSFDAASLRLGTVSSFAVGPDRNVYVGEYTGSLEVKVFAPDGTLLREWGTYGKGDGQFLGVTGIGFDRQGNIYTADFGNVRVQVFDKTGSFLRAFPTEPPVGPVGIGLDPAGNIYVANARTSDHYVQKYAPDGRPLLSWGHTGEFGVDPNGQTGRLAIDEAGNVYIPDFANGYIQKFDGNGKSLGSIGEPGLGEDQFRPGSPGGVTVDRRGNIYATDQGNIVTFDPQGRFLVRWVGAAGSPAGEFTAGAGVKVDAEGNIYIKNQGSGGILMFRQR
jgi:tripartite motif-containing protein 71